MRLFQSIVCAWLTSGFLATPSNAADTWLLSCKLERFPCHLVGDALILWLWPDDRVTGTVRLGAVTGVSLVVGNHRIFLSAERDFLLSPHHQSYLGTNEAWFLIEFADGAILRQAAPSLSKLFDSPESKQHPDSVLDHLAARQDLLENAPVALLPSTKPQVEFAIRSQGGNSIYSPTGR